MNIQTQELSVSIKVIKVNSKGMTLSVFKQLPEKCLFDDDLNFNGNVWGQVNYRLPHQAINSTNLIWQEGNQLFKYELRPLTDIPYNYKKRELDSDLNIANEIPLKSLFGALSATPIEDIESLNPLFMKYKTQYELLRETDQLYIAV